MNFTCDDCDRVLGRGASPREQAGRRREHLRTCRRCREQAAAHAALQGSFSLAPPELSVGFQTRLRRRLDAPRSPARWRSAWIWTLAAYVTAATFASVELLSRVSWETVAAPRAFGVTLVAFVLASPMLLLDRIGILRPPG